MNQNSKKIFNPRHYSSDIETTFTRFVRKFDYIYEGENRTAPATANTAELLRAWKLKDKSRLFLSWAVSDEFLDDFEATTTEAERNDITFTTFVTKMKERYAPTSNKVQNHYKFHRLNQQIAETFDDFTHRVKAEAKLCKFKCDSETCTVQDTLIRDQLIVGTWKEAIREEALKKQWDLTTLINKGCTIESSVAAASEIKQEHTIPINRAAAGVYSKRHKKEHPLQLWDLCGVPTGWSL